ncbi:hypothetical protein CMEL01_14824 [Colletotrichum melonis]|uniref:Uncharacterized protein n=1 Tax=Colletotrichum melonis TaxID=1209925 RepID=A0AAI9XVJ6_9PEZI|nr:hypothetical protein CMEL01_14824 [Colletotrichum melonis]
MLTEANDSGILTVRESKIPPRGRTPFLNSGPNPCASLHPERVHLMATAAAAAANPKLRFFHHPSAAEVSRHLLKFPGPSHPRHRNTPACQYIWRGLPLAHSHRNRVPIPIITPDQRIRNVSVHQYAPERGYHRALAPQAVPSSAPRSESRADATLAPYKYLLGRAKDGASRSDPVKAGDVLRVI